MDNEPQTDLVPQDIKVAARLSSLASAGLPFDQLHQQINDVLFLHLAPVFIGLYLVDEMQQYARFYGGSGKAAARMLADHFNYALYGTSTVSKCYQNSQELRTREPDLAILDYYTNARLEICVPVKFAGEIYGIYSGLWDHKDVHLEAADQLLLISANLLGMRLHDEKIQNENRGLRYQSERRTKLQLALRRIAGILNQASNRLTLLTQIIEILCETFDLYYAGIFLANEDHTWADLVAGYGSAGEIMLRNHHRLRIGGQSMVGTSIQLGEVRVAMDVGEEQIHFRNPLLPHTRSELAIPLRYQKTILGALSIQSRRERAFSQDDLMVLQTLGDFISSALVRT